MLNVINRKINSVLSFLAQGTPEDRAKIEELGFADKAETDKILVALDENKIELLDELAAAEKEELRTREVLLNTLHTNDLSFAIANRLLLVIAKINGFNAGDVEDIDEDAKQRVAENFSKEEIAEELSDKLKEIDGLSEDDIAKESNDFAGSFFTEEF